MGLEVRKSDLSKYPSIPVLGMTSYPEPGDDLKWVMLPSELQDNVPTGYNALRLDTANIPSPVNSAANAVPLHPELWPAITAAASGEMSPNDVQTYNDLRAMIPDFAPDYSSNLLVGSNSNFPQPSRYRPYDMALSA